MNGTKIRLSSEEMALVKNSSWILTKNKILEKATHLLAGLQVEYSKILHPFANNLPVEFSASSPKISRGENYEGLPYRVLDFPAVFSKENSIAIRTLFWWGNYFSITLHLSGLYKQRFVRKILQNFSELSHSNFYICVGENQWNHQFTDDNFRKLSSLNVNAINEALSHMSFIKIAAKTGIDDWENATILLSEQFTLLVKTLVD